LNQYLQLDELREGMMWVAGKLYGFEFAPVTDALLVIRRPGLGGDTQRQARRPVVFRSVRTPWKALRSLDELLSRPKNTPDDQKPIVSNNSNFVKGAPGEPLLISWDDALTLFHEFGHALHGLSSDVKYPSQSGTSVARDYVEFPSQLNERWLRTPEVLSHFALHHETREPIPRELIEKLELAAHSNQGFLTTEALACALVDMKLHSMAEARDFDASAFE
jgi:peptidyl-dipeptidase Dcp